MSSAVREAHLAWLREVMHRLFDVDPTVITPDAHFADDLELDSIDAIDLMVELQQRTERRIDEDIVKRVRTVGDILDLAEEYLPCPPQ